MITSKLRFLIPAVVLLAFAGGFMDAAKRKTLTQKEKFAIAIQGIAKKKALKPAQKEAQIRQQIELFDSGPKALTEKDMVDVLTTEKASLKADAVVDKIVKELTPVPADPRVAFLQDVAKLNKGNVVADLPKIVKDDAGEIKLVKDDSIKIEGNLKDNLDAKLQEISFARIKDLISAVTKKGAKHFADDKLKGILDYKNKDDKADLKKAQKELDFNVKDGVYTLAQLTDEQLKDLNNFALEKVEKLTESKAKSVAELNKQIKVVHDALTTFVADQEQIVQDTTVKASGAKTKIVITPGLTKDFNDAKDALTPLIGDIKLNKTKLKEVQAEHSRVTAVNFLAVEKKTVSDAAKAIKEFVDQEVAKQGGGAPVVFSKEVTDWIASNPKIEYMDGFTPSEIKFNVAGKASIPELKQAILDALVLYKNTDEYKDAASQQDKDALIGTIMAKIPKDLR